MDASLILLTTGTKEMEWFDCIFSPSPNSGTLIHVLLGLIIFGLVWFGFYQKKITKLIFFFIKKLKSNRNQFKPTGFGSVWFFRTKTGSNRFASVFFGLGSVRFSFIGFRLIKPKQNRTGWFFKILID
jgi:hypothetical protein